jgi:hypothetical protein
METRDWRRRSAWIADLLKRRTGDDLESWTTRVDAGAFLDESSLRAWLTEQGVTGYPQQMLVMERVGYPAFLLASTDELIDGQYADRPQLRPILDAVLAAAGGGAGRHSPPKRARPTFLCSRHDEPLPRFRRPPVIESISA